MARRFVRRAEERVSTANWMSLCAALSSVVPAEAWRKPGPIPRNLSVAFGGRRSSQNETLGLWVQDQRSLSLACPGRRGEISQKGLRQKSAFSRRLSPELCMFTTLKNAEGAGKAGCSLHPRTLAQKGCARARRPQVQAESHRPSPAQWFTAYSVLFPVNQLLPPSYSQCLWSFATTWRLHRRARTTRLRRPRMRRTSIGPSASTASRLTFRDDAYAPRAEAG
jgi:hypothetical protein